MLRPLRWIEIDLAAIRRNLRWVRKRLSGGVRLMAVVKADGYGHGAEAVAFAAAGAGADCLGVLTVEEAAALRRAGIRAPIVLLAPPLPEQAPWVARLSLEATADSEALLSALNRAARRPLAVHLDVDLGLRRWGITPSGLPAVLRKLAGLKRLRLAGLSTHIDYVPGRNAVEAEQKLRAFQRLAANARRIFPRVLCHAANSSILMDFPHWQLDMVRVGNLLYGINPASSQAALQRPWRFLARIIAITEVGAGHAVGYAGEYIAPRRMRLATLPVGYSDGLTMEPAERFIGLGRGFKYWGMLRGQRALFVGRCAISHVLVDVSRVPGAKVGDIVQLPLRRTAASLRIPRVYSG